MNTLNNYTKIKYAGGKYWAVYLPDHPDALSDGYVYEHRIVASLILGRNLTNMEFVHHKDKNGLNNSPENLMVFASNADHVAFHHGADIYIKDGVFYAKSFMTKENYYCIDCNKKIQYKSTRCKNCHALFNNKMISRKPDRNILKNLLMNNSFVAIGKIYGVSDNAVRKWCKYYGLPHKSKDIKLLSENEWSVL